MTRVHHFRVPGQVLLFSATAQIPGVTYSLDLSEERLTKMWACLCSCVFLKWGCSLYLLHEVTAKIKED